MISNVLLFVLRVISIALLHMATAHYFSQWHPPHSLLLSTEYYTKCILKYNFFRNKVSVAKLICPNIFILYELGFVMDYKPNKQTSFCCLIDNYTISPLSYLLSFMETISTE